MASMPEHLLSVPAGKARLPKQVMEEHQRDRVIAAAIGVFARRGYQATTVDHIVAASKTGVGSFYALFDGKEDCFLQALDRVLNQGRTRIAESVSAVEGPPERVAAALRALLGMVSAEPQSARLVVVEAQTAGPEARARYEHLLSDASLELRRCRDGSIAAAGLPETLEDSILGGLTWLLHQRLLGDEVEGIEAIYPDLVGIVLSPYLGEARVGELVAAL